MHVVHVYKDVYPPVAGGIEKHIDLIRRALPCIRHDVLVCARRPRTTVRELDTGVEVHVAEFGPRIWSVPVSPRYPLALRVTDADIVHLHMPHPLGEIAALMDRRRPLVCSYHADVVRQARVAPAYRKLLHACFERANEVVVGSRRLAETSPFLGRYGPLARVIPYFIETERYARQAVSDDAVAAVRSLYGSPIVLSVGRLVYYKGLDVLIEAARSLRASVVIAGAGPLAGRLQQQARDIDNVHLVGGLEEDQLLAHLAAADCFVLASTSRAESFGIAVLEAQAMGVPAVVTDVGTGTVETIAPEESGLVVQAGDPTALANAITQILADDARRSRMGELARERVLQRHSSERASAQLLAVYERCLHAAT